MLGHIVWGMWDGDATWAELDTALATNWHHPLGGRIGIDATCIDGSDGVTMEAIWRAVPLLGRPARDRRHRVHYRICHAPAVKVWAM